MRPPALFQLLFPLCCCLPVACAAREEHPLRPAALEPAPAQGAFDAANAAFEAGRYEEAAAAYERALGPNAPAAAEAEGEEWYRYGYALHVTGNLQRALAAHERATDFPKVAPSAAYNLACAHALLGHPDEAFAALDRAVGLGFRGLAQMEGDPDLASLRADPRWAPLKEKVEAAVQGG